MRRLDSDALAYACQLMIDTDCARMSIAALDALALNVINNVGE